MSGQHVVRLLHFRSLLEHFLVEKFTLATLYHLKDFEGGSDSWSRIESNLSSWKQWLLDDKDTCNYQLHHLQHNRNVLESDYLNIIRPPRDLDKYTSASHSNRHSLDYTSSLATTSSQKWGYLFMRTTRNNWIRRWFFLYDGCFGSCYISNSRSKGMVAIGDRVSVLLCDVKPITDIDRRFCFEVVCAQQPSFVLQAETEEEMREWIGAFEKSKRLMLQNEQLDFNKTSDMADTAGAKPKAAVLSEQDASHESEPEKPSIVLLSNVSENETLSQSTSLTPLFVREAAHSNTTTTQNIHVDSNPTQSPSTSTTTVTTANGATSVANNSSWGIPWALVPSMFQSSSNDDIVGELPPTSSTTSISDAEGNQIVWPIRTDDAAVPKVDLVGYSADLDASNKELRQLFGGVGQQEVVLTAFVGLLKKKPKKAIEQIPELPMSPTTPNPSVDQLEQELNAQLPTTVKEPVSTFGYSYTGKGFITQETFWFYSCMMMNCVNTVAVRLTDIKAIRIIRDTSIANDGTNSNRALVIDLAHTVSEEPLVFIPLMDDVEVLREKLQFAIENAKSSKPAPLQTTYDVVHSLSASKLKGNNQVKTIIRSAAEPLPSVSSSAASLPELSSATSKSTDTKKKSSAPRKFSAPVKPKSGALAAAMMAATVAGGSGFFEARKELQEEYQNILKSKKSKPVLNNVPVEDTISVADQGESVTTSNNEGDDAHAPPKDFKAPTGPVSCGCSNHLDKLESEVELPVSAKQLYYLLFDDDNPNYIDIWEKKTVENKSKNLTMTKWGKGIDGNYERTLKYIIPVNNAMVKLKEAEAIEKQVIEKKEDYLCYVVMTTTKTPQLPYADAFVPYLKYCITWISQDRCKLACHTGVKFLKNILVKGIVSKAAMKGMSENLEIFVPIIQSEAKKQFQPKGAEVADAVSLKRTGTIKRQPSTTVNSEKDKKEGWYEQYVDPVIQTVHDTVDMLPFAVKVSVAAIAFIWLLYSWLFSSSRPIEKASSQHQVVSRAVYLKDIDEGLINVDIRSAFDGSDSFRLFLESKSRNNTIRYHWHSAHHRQLAIDLLFSRERVAMLRHDALVLFQLVNEVDTQLLENEYINWLLDARLQCLMPGADYDALYCEDVQRQLTKFPVRYIK
ncbi:hypothetical protein RMATCC62417_00026 [Rhizopus microsporus]|nr:hypothetical protein RMATCC62417_00026 [Rhizopus microsporus]